MTEDVCNHNCGECKYYMRPYCTYNFTEELRYENILNNTDIRFQTSTPVWDTKEKVAVNVSEMINIMNQQQWRINTLEIITRSALYDLNKIDDYENYSLQGTWGNFTLHSIKEDKMIVTPLGVVERLNKLSKQNQLLKLKNKNALSMLDSFMDVLKEVLKDPDSEYYQNLARNMLNAMGKDVNEVKFYD